MWALLLLSSDIGCLLKASYFVLVLLPKAFPIAVKYFKVSSVPKVSKSTLATVPISADGSLSIVAAQRWCPSNM